MFDLGWGELLLIGIVALIVVGPKDLPNLFRSIGQFTGKARAMARDFSRAMEAAADDSGIKDIDKTIRAAANPMRSATDSLREATGLKNLPRTPAQALKSAVEMPKPGEPLSPAATTPATSASATSASGPAASAGAATAEFAARRASEKAATAEAVAARQAPAATPAPAGPADTTIKDTAE